MPDNLPIVRLNLGGTSYFPTIENEKHKTESIKLSVLYDFTFIILTLT